MFPRISQHRLWRPNGLSFEAPGEWRGPACEQLGRKSGALAPVQGRGDWVAGPARESAAVGLSQSLAASAWLAPASWEAGGPEALSELAVSESDKERTFSHRERESCQDPGKDQVVGDESRLLAGFGGRGRRSSHPLALLPAGCSISPPVGLRLQGGTTGFRNGRLEGVLERVWRPVAVQCT